jgi:hypothetical protein
MRMSETTYAAIRDPLLKEMEIRPQTNAHTPMRYRWDCLWACVDRKEIAWSLLRDLDDEHIDTALRKLAVYAGKVV